MTVIDVIDMSRDECVIEMGKIWSGLRFQYALLAMQADVKNTNICMYIYIYIFLINMLSWADLAMSFPFK